MKKKKFKLYKVEEINNNHNSNNKIKLNERNRDQKVLMDKLSHQSLILGKNNYLIFYLK